MKNPGFTLVETLVVIAIISIIVAIALPNYQDSVRKARRADAKKDLVGIAGFAERIFTESGSYNSDLDSDGDVDLVAAAAEASGRSDGYTYTVAVAAGTHTITATPTSTQAADPCGTMTITQTGQTTAAEAYCWKR